MKILEFRRSGNGLVAELRGIPNGFPNQARQEEEEEGAALVLAAQTATRGGSARGSTMCCGAVAAAAGMQQLWSDAILNPSLLTILHYTTVLWQIMAILL
jgi:hypothetical protein